MSGGYPFNELEELDPAVKVEIHREAGTTLWHCIISRASEGTTLSIDGGSRASAEDAIEEALRKWKWTSAWVEDFEQKGEAHAAPIDDEIPF